MGPVVKFQRERQYIFSDSRFLRAAESFDAASRRQSKK